MLNMRFFKLIKKQQLTKFWHFAIYFGLSGFIVYQFIISINASSLNRYDFIFLLQGLKRTISLSLTAIAIGSFLGIILGWSKASAGKIGNLLLSAVLDVVRTVPLIIQFILFYATMGILGIDVSVFWVGAIVLSAYTAAFVTEVVRAGIEAVPKTTRLAARSLGMTYLQDFFYIVLPLGFRVVFPAWIGIILSVIKDSALVSVIGYLELLKSTEELISKTQETLLLLVGVGVFYFVISYPVSLYATYVQRKFES